MFLAGSAPHSKLHVYYYVFSKDEPWEMLFWYWRPSNTGWIIMGIINLLSRELYRFHITPNCLIMYKNILPVVASFSCYFCIIHTFNMRKCWNFFSLLLSLLCLEFGQELVKDVLHTELLLQPLRGYLLAREEKATWSLSEEIEEKKQLLNHLEIMSVVTVNKSSQTTQCCASQQQTGPTAGWFAYETKVKQCKECFCEKTGVL